MSNRRLLDTNMIVRYLTRDHEKHARTALKLFEACDRGEIILVLLPTVLAECVFVLESFYKQSSNDIVRTLSNIISSPGIELADAEIHLDALVRYGNSKAHFTDCVIASYAAAKKISVATFDTDFKKFKDVRVEVD